MRRYIIKNCLVGTAWIMLVVTLFGLSIQAKYQLDDIRERMLTFHRQFALRLSESQIDQADEYILLEDVYIETESAMRITLIDANSVIYYDNEMNDDLASVYYESKEVTQAFASGYSEIYHISNLDGRLKLYIVTLLPNGHLLHTCYPVAVIFLYMRYMIPMLVVLYGVMFITIMYFAKRFSSRLIRPLQQIQTLLHEKDAGMPLQVDQAFKEEKAVLADIQFLIHKLYQDLAIIHQTEEVRTDFIAHASHELKSPVTSIRGYAELLSMGFATDEATRKDYLARLHAETTRMQVLIDDILSLSRAESRPPAPIFEIDLTRVTLEVVRALESQASPKNIQMTVYGAGTVLAQDRDMWEITYNLVSNAIRYGKTGGHVEIWIEPSAKETRLSVRDDGLGIAPEHITRIFERFYRAHPAYYSNGTGLGLPIVKQLAAKYNAVVSVDSVPDQGSVFTVTFPVEPQAPPK